jgi:hypothetical protein
LIFQGGLLKQPKKSQVITEDMISRNTELSSLDDNNDNQVRRRHKNKPQKSANTTLLIGNTQPIKDDISHTDKQISEKSGKISENSNTLNTETNSKLTSSQEVTSSTKLNSKVTLSNGDDVISGDAKSGASSKSTNDTDGWNKNLQTIFEWGLRQYPKGTDQRWERIAHHIPGKSKVWLS